MRRPAVVAAASAVALLALACAGGAAPPPDRAAKGKPVAFTTIVQRAIPGQAGQQVRTVVRDADSWRAVWAELRKDGGEALPAEPPAVDFPREMVLVVAMPTQSCVSKVTIQSIGHLGNPTGGTLLVNLLEAPPAPNCRCIVASRPVHAVRLPRTGGIPRFVVTRGQTSCGS
ncbi:MAG TPA: hypothetical protein VLB76_15895 [Thermoanaerobaculia bacterium]|nr:hypothetical protein [Thermoanaerobaculia bacterium]